MTAFDVLIVSPWHSGPGASGVVTAGRGLAEGLAENPAVGEVVLLSLGAERASERLADNLRVEVLPRQKRLTLLANAWPDYRRAARWLEDSKFSPDIVHAQGFAGEGLVAVRLARRRRVPAVITVHGMIDKEAKLYGDPVRAVLARRVMYQTLRGTDGIVFSSPYRREELTLSPRVDGRVIENAISEDAFGYERTGRGTAIVYGAFIGPRKRLLDLVRALPKVRAAAPEVTLRVAGPVSDQAYGRAVEAEVAALGLSDAVTFLGPLDATSMRKELAAAGVLALPSEEENAPLVISEAMANGLPIVATDVGGVAWMVEDGVAGYVVPPGDVDALADRLTAVLTDPARWEAMSAASRAAGERFRPAVVAERTLELYRALAARGR